MATLGMLRSLWLTRLAKPAGERVLKGFSRPIPVYAVNGMRPVEASA